PAHGSVVVNANGSYTYTPAANYHGPDSFTYTVTDAASGDRLTRTVYLTVKPVVDLTANADKVATNEDTPVSGSVATNDSTTSGGALAYALTSGPAHGTLVFQADGSYTYTPVADYNGPDSFTYTVTDAAAGERMTQTVTLSIAPVVDIADDAVKTEENRPVKIAVLANDSFEGKPVISAVSPGAHGSVRINQDGTVTYTPNLGWSGEDSFTYTVTSPTGVLETATVKVTVIANPIPVGQSNPGNGFAKPLLAPIQTDPALHVLISVNEARNEMSLRSGLGIFQADSVTTAELMGAVNPDLSFASGVAGRSGALDQSNALHVQHAVRHLPLVMNDTLHVQNSVRASQLESAARNAHVSAYHSATPGISTLFDPFALGAPAVGVKQGVAADDGKKTTPKSSSSTDAGQAAHDEQVTGTLEKSQPDQPAQTKPATTRAHAAAGFGSQLQRVAADFRPRLARPSSARVASR
ncbi:MAG: Ig-like domain-containing protein, partial [Polaromonas sp.]